MVLHLDAGDTIETIKFKIEDKTQIPPDNQLLVFSGKELNNQHTVAVWHMKKPSWIDVLLRVRGGMKIFVQTAIDKRIAMEVNASDTISMVLSKLDDTNSVPMGTYLTLRGEPLEDPRSLSHYDITNDTVLELMPPLALKVLGLRCLLVLYT